MNRLVFGGALVVLGVVGSAAVAAPTNTVLPSGWSWVPAGSGSYDTGLQGTKRGGFNGQTVGPFEDTSFGIMDESGTAWFDGSDLSAQQYVQRQIFGNFGTGSPPGPAGARFFNFGYGGTSSGSNFPRTAAEQRSISLNHWNNPNPDAGGIASFGQIVYVPVAATLTTGLGWGADEMLLKIIGGGDGRSQFFVDATLNASFTTAAFGGISSTGNSIRVNAVVQGNNAGSGSYDIGWGFGASNSSGNPSVTRVGGIDAVFLEGVFSGDPTQGIPVNSVGASLSKSYDVLASLVQSGGAFNLTFNADADINNLVRDFGNADARASMGPGFEGNARLVVQWQAFQAIPTPGALALLGAAGLLMGRRRR